MGTLKSVSIIYDRNTGKTLLSVCKKTEMSDKVRKTTGFLIKMRNT